MCPAGLAPGELIDGRYVVEAELGRGGYGVVWRVRHRRLDALRALKVLHDPDPEVAERLREEGQVLARLEHPHVVRVHDLVELGDGLALVMELVDGPTLAQRLQEGPVPLAQVESIGRGLLEGLLAAHRQGVLHRDLKPGNLLLAEGPHGVIPKLVDFGLAVADGTGGHQAAGTPAYMAPEQMEGRFDERSDVYCAATVLYELATGRKAFEGRSLSQLMMAKAEGRFEHPRRYRPDLPAGMAHALVRALAPRPEGRTATVAELLAAWRSPSDAAASPASEVPHMRSADLASLGDSRATDRALLRRLPTPVARAWARVVTAPSDDAQRVALDAARRRVLRLLVAMALAESLAAPSDEVLAWVRQARRDEPAQWLAGLATMASCLEGRGGGLVPVAGLRVGQPLWLALEALMAGEATPDRVAELRGVLVSLGFLEQLRLVRCLGERSEGGWRVQLLVGDSPSEPAPSQWSGSLVAGALYVVDAAGQRALRLGPLVRRVAGPELDEVFQLWAGFDDDGVLHMVEASGQRGRLQAVESGLPSTLEGLLASAGGCWVHHGSDALGTLGPLEGGSSSGAVVGGRFELRGVLGAGGMSTVHRAFDRLTDTEVALKLLAVDFAADPEFRERFKREAARMRQLDHPRVLSAVELGSLDSGQLWLSMPVLGGGTLRERLARGPLDAADAMRWAKQLLSALVALRSAGVVHRDIKPSNLLLDDADDLVMVDFGVALSEDDARLTRTLQQLGSLAYLAPECRGAGEASHKSDVYSAALVIHELFTGRAAGALPGKGLPGEVGSWLRRMGAIDPDDRPSAAEVLAAWTGSGSQPVLAEGAAEPPGARDRRLLALGVPLGVLAGVLWGLPAWTILARQLAADHAVTGMLASRVGEGPHLWAAAAVATALPFVAGLGLPSARGHGALAGAVVALVAFAVGGVQLAVLVGAEPAYEALASGPADVATVLGDVLVRLSWLLLGGSLVAAVAGAVLGAAGASVQQRSPVVIAPDPRLRQIAGAGIVAISTSTAATWSTLDMVLGTIERRAVSSVGLELTLGVVSGLATVPWLAGQVLGLWLCASPRVQVVRGETLLRVILLGVVLGTQALMADETTWAPPVLSAVVLGGVLVWRRPWEVEPKPSPPTDVMAVVSAGLAAVAVASVGMPLAHLGLSMESTLLWSLPALQGLSDAVPAAERVEAHLQHHFAFTRLVLATSALLTLICSTLWVAIESGYLALGGRLAEPGESLRAIGLGSLVVSMMLFGTGHDLFETSRADPRVAVPDVPDPEVDTAWRLWVQGDLLHGVWPESDSEGERLIAAVSAHLRGRQGPSLLDSPREQALAAALQGDPARLHAWLEAHDDPLLASLHHGVGAVAWGDDPHDDLQPELAVEWLLAGRRAADARGRDSAWASYEEAVGQRSPLWLERAQQGEPGALQSAIERAPGRHDVRVEALIAAIWAHDAEGESHHREALGFEGTRVRREVDHVVAVAEAYVAVGRLRDARDLLLAEIKVLHDEERVEAAAAAVGAGVALLSRPGLGGELLAADVARRGEAAPPAAPGPCDEALGLALQGDAADGLARIEEGRCPPTPGVAVWEALLRAVLARSAMGSEGEVHREWLRQRWRAADPMPASEALFEAP